ncbi:MAG TPA: FGGY family carbohydrate kinase, partial [Streptosporangiaceae bacterium]
MTGDDGLYLGVDVGTSATRVSLVRPDGTGVAASAVAASAVVASAVVASAGYRTVRGGDGRVEQDPAAWSRALATALRRLQLRLQLRPGEDGVDLRAVTAVGLCGQTPTLVLVDEAGRAVRPALTWQDTRATAEAAELGARFG